MGTDQLTYTETLSITQCWCGIRLAIPANLLRQAHDRPDAIDAVVQNTEAETVAMDEEADHGEDA